MQKKTPATKHIVCDILRRTVGSVDEDGLIDSEDKHTLEKHVRDLKATWDHLVSTFNTWFITNEAELAKS
jgi:hypothetical protein